MGANLKNARGSIAAIYVFISGIVLIKSSAVIMAESLAETIVLLMRDTPPAGSSQAG